MQAAPPPDPPAVTLTIAVGAGNQLMDAPNPACPDGSTPCGSSNGALDFSHQNRAVEVTLNAPGGWVFMSPSSGGYCISFADHPSDTKSAVRHGHHQFPNDVSGCGTPTVTFTYENENNCGSGHAGDCASSIYGYVLQSGGTVIPLDPLIQNGGNDSVLD